MDPWLQSSPYVAPTLAASQGPDAFDPTDLGPEWALHDEIEAHHPRFIKMTRWGQNAYWRNYDQMPINGNMAAAADHCEAVINARLALEYVKEFRIGITSDPIRRWSHKPTAEDSLRGYQLVGFHEMRILISTQRQRVVGPLERRLLIKYRHYDYEAKRPRTGHYLCGNMRRGGEGADFGPGPYYLYVVFQFNPGLFFFHFLVWWLGLFSVGSS
jgi:hypothetical protein